MVVNAIIEVGRKHAAPLVPTRHVAKPADTRPRARVVNVSKEEMRHHEAVMEARHAAQSVRNDLQSAANALSAANEENDRLSKRVKELESENARIRKELESKKQECSVLSEALDGLKSGANMADGVPPPPPPPAQSEPAAPVSAKRKKNRNRKKQSEPPTQVSDGAVQQ